MVLSPRTSSTLLCKKQPEHAMYRLVLMTEAQVNRFKAPFPKENFPHSVGKLSTFLCQNCPQSPKSCSTIHFNSECVTKAPSKIYGNLLTNQGRHVYCILVFPLHLHHSLHHRQLELDCCRFGFSSGLHHHIQLSRLTIR